MHKSIKEIKWYAFESDEIPIQYRKPYRYVYRTVNAYLTFVIQFLPITPNMLSAMMSVFTFLGAICFVFQSQWLWLLGVGLLYIGELLDWTDGTIARIKKIKSPIMSKYLDGYFHEVPRQFLFLFIGISAYNITVHNQMFWLSVGFVALIFQFLTVHLHRFKEDIIFMTFPDKAVQLLDMDNKDNALSKDSNLMHILFEIAVFPLKQIKGILLITVIISFWYHNLLYFILLGYAIWIFIRYIALFIVTYITLKRLEKDVKC
jgi:hypothetical protein